MLQVYMRVVFEQLKSTIDTEWSLVETDMVLKIVTQLKHFLYAVSEGKAVLLEMIVANP